MISQDLQKARNYEETTEKKIKEQDRPAFHLSPRTGWMNDPNGFSYYKGMYHMFYQYYPYDTHWGPMHWGHAVSKDLISWEYLPAALAPDTDYDKDGCFSGSATELPDGRQLLLYTGVRREEQENGEIKDIQTQCVAVGDGINYEKYDRNPVLTQKNLPEGGSKFDFRDPKIWRNEDGTYGCVVANCDSDKDGCILKYRSENGFEWEYDTTVLVNGKRIGKMWECPDYFRLQGKQMLIVSPQEVMPEALERHNGNGTICIMGEGEQSFADKSVQTLDYGIDFYAPQTIQTPDGRRIMIGWLNNWDTWNAYHSNQLWFGQMSLPRELSIVNGRLIQKPAQEIEKLRTERVSYEQTITKKEQKFDGICGRMIDMEVEIEPENAQEMYHSIQIRFAQEKSYYCSVSYRPHESVIEIDRTYSGTRTATIHKRSCQVKKDGGNIKIRMILDRYSAEVFVNDGEQVLSMAIYSDTTADGISFIADGSAQVKVVKYNLAK